MTHKREYERQLYCTFQYKQDGVENEYEIDKINIADKVEAINELR